MSAPLFDAPEPAPIVADRFAGMGVDARRTQRQRDNLAAGIHPLTRMPLHPEAAQPDRESPGLRCRDCSHHHRVGDWWKCARATHQGGSASSDLRLWWPACVLFMAAES